MLYRDTRGSGPELVLLHGWGMNAAVWSDLAAALAGQCRVTLIELPGHGESPLLPGGSLAQWARACIEAAPPRAVWLGWSLGALVALQAALEAPSRITRLLLTAGTPRFVQSEDWPCAMPQATFQQFSGALAQDPQTALDRFLALQVRGTADARVTLRSLRGGFRERPAALPQALEQGLELLRSSDLRPYLGGLDCPSRWLLGERDTLVPWTVARQLPGVLPGARVEVLAGAGHAPFLSHRQAFAGWVRESLG